MESQSEYLYLVTVNIFILTAEYRREDPEKTDRGRQANTHTETQTRTGACTDDDGVVVGDQHLAVDVDELGDQVLL